MADQLFKKRKSERKKREIRQRKMKSDTWLFVCEGTKTEVNYLTKLIEHANSRTSEPPIIAEITGQGRNTESLVKSAQNIIDGVSSVCSCKTIPYGKVFILFDKDSFTDAQFNSAVQMSEERGYIPVWSNECFELWYLLHFLYLDSNITRNDYCQKLEQYLGKEYKKADDIFSELQNMSNIGMAKRYSESLEKKYSSGESPAHRSPCTQMHKLIAEIEKRLNIKL